MVYRISGDEFAIIVRDIHKTVDVEIIASHIIALFKESFSLQSIIVQVSLSIGAVIYPVHGKSMEDLMKYADLAMNRAKATGRNHYVIYDDNMSKAFEERLHIEKCMHLALERNEFEVYYQPQLDLQRNAVTGMEALLRWNSPELGFVSPAKFIPVAEDTRLIIQLGAWVLRTACSYMKKLHNLGHHELYIAVNVSILQLLQTDFSEMVLDIFGAYRYGASFSRTGDNRIPF